MEHSHAHSHGDAKSTYFLDQLCTIAVCGLLGFTAIMAYRTGMLERINLIPEFHKPVMAAGIALIVMVAFRAIAIWRQAGESNHEEAAAEVEGASAAPAAPAPQHAEGAQCDHEHHDHGHSHGHEHSHSHGHEHSHAHDHGSTHKQPQKVSTPNDDEESHDDHDHGWSPWTYAVLIIPAVLYFLNLPVGGYNMTRLQKDLKEQDLDPGRTSQRFALANVVGSTVVAYYKKSGDPVQLTFGQLTELAGHERKRDAYEGKTVVLKGQFSLVPGKDKVFQLFRVKISCCGADAITLKSQIIAPEPLSGYKFEDWVRIEGELTFQAVAGGRGEWVPVIRLPNMESIQRIEKPENLFDDV